MMAYQNLTEKKLTSELIFDGKVLHIYRDTVSLPDGNTASREYIRHIGAVCVVPLTENGQVMVERQYRYPIGKVTLEIPAGKLNTYDEPPTEAARRELKEETGVEAGELIDLGDFYPAAAYSDERIRIFLARNLAFGQTQPDEDEFLSVELISLEELVREILAGNVPDAKTQAAVLRVYFMMKEGLR